MPVLVSEESFPYFNEADRHHISMIGKRSRTVAIALQSKIGLRMNVSWKLNCLEGDINSACSLSDNAEFMSAPNPASCKNL